MKKRDSYIKGLVNTIWGEFKLIFHDPGIILFLAFLPLAYPVIYSLIYNPELVKDVPFVVVDDDRTAESRELVRSIDACDEARLAGYAADMGEARRAMDSHECFAILEIPAGFSRKLGRAETAPAVIYCDMSLLLRYRGFLVATTEVMQEMGSSLLTTDINTELPLAETIVTGDLLPINNVSMGNIRNGFDSFIMPGVLILILHQCILLALGMSGGARYEKSRRRRYVPGWNSRYVLGGMIGRSISYFIILLAPAVYMLYYVPLMFRFPMAGSLPEELLFIFPMVLACFGMGFVFQAFVTQRESVFVSWVVTSIIFLLLSGLIWPRYDMPEGWRFISGLLPSTWGVEGFIKMNANGADLAQVRHEYIMLWLLAAAWWTAGWISQKFAVIPSVYSKEDGIAGESAV